jgi:hypothetical protein
MAVANILAYYVKATMMAVKSFIIWDAGFIFTNFLKYVLTKVLKMVMHKFHKNVF